jgi:hypothetical protein
MYANATYTRNYYLGGANTAQRLRDRGVIYANLKSHTKLLEISSKLIR